MPHLGVTTAALRSEWQALARSPYFSNGRSLLAAKALLQKTVAASHAASSYSCESGKNITVKKQQSSSSNSTASTFSPSSDAVLRLLSNKKASCRVWSTLRRHQVPWHECLQLLQLQISALERNQRQKAYIEAVCQSNPSHLYRVVLQSWAQCASEVQNSMKSDDQGVAPLYATLMGCTSVVAFGKMVRTALQSRPALRGVLPVPFSVLDHFYRLAFRVSTTPSSRHHGVSSPAEVAMKIAANVALLDPSVLSATEKERVVLAFAKLCGHCGRWDEALKHLQSAPRVVGTASREAFMRFAQQQQRQQGTLRRTLSSSSTFSASSHVSVSAPVTNGCRGRTASCSHSSSSDSEKEDVVCSAIGAASNWMQALEMYIEAAVPDSGIRRRTAAPATPASVPHIAKCDTERSALMGTGTGSTETAKIAAERFSALVARQDLPLSTAPDTFLTLFAQLPAKAQTFAVLHRLTQRIPRDHPRYVLMVSRALQLSGMGERMYSGVFTRRCHTLLRRADWAGAIGLMCGVRALDLALPVVAHVPRTTLLPPELYAYAAEVEAIRMAAEKKSEPSGRVPPCSSTCTLSIPSAQSAEDGGGDADVARVEDSVKIQKKAVRGRECFIDPDEELAKALARALYSTDSAVTGQREPTPQIALAEEAMNTRTITAAAAADEMPLFAEYQSSPRLVALLCARELQKMDALEAAGQQSLDDRGREPTGSHSGRGSGRSMARAALEKAIDCFTFVTPEATRLVLHYAEQRKRSYFASVVPAALRAFHGLPVSAGSQGLVNQPQSESGNASIETLTSRRHHHRSQKESGSARAAGKKPDMDAFRREDEGTLDASTRNNHRNVASEAALDTSGKNDLKVLVAFSSSSSSLHRLQRWLLQHPRRRSQCLCEPITISFSSRHQGAGDAEVSVMMQRRLAAWYASGHVVADFSRHNTKEEEEDDEEGPGQDLDSPLPMVPHAVDPAGLGATQTGECRPAAAIDACSLLLPRTLVSMTNNSRSSSSSSSSSTSSSEIAFAALINAICVKGGQWLDASTILHFYTTSSLRPYHFLAEPEDLWGTVGAAIVEAYAITHCWGKALELFQNISAAAMSGNRRNKNRSEDAFSPSSSNVTLRQCQAVESGDGEPLLMPSRTTRSLHPRLLEAAMKALYAAPDAVAVKVLENQILATHAYTPALPLRDIIAHRDTRALRGELRRLTDQLSGSLHASGALTRPQRRALRHRRRVLIGMAFALLHDLPALEAVTRACRQKRITPADVDAFGFQRLLFAVEPKVAAQRLLEWRGTIEVHWLWTLLAHRELSQEDRASLAAQRPFDEGVQSILLCVNHLAQLRKITQEETLSKDGEMVALRACGEALRAMLTLAQTGSRNGTNTWALPLTLLLQQFCEITLEHDGRGAWWGTMPPSSTRSTIESSNLLSARALFNLCSQTSPSLQRALHKTKKWILPILVRPQHQTSPAARSRAPLLIAGFLHHHLSRGLQRPIPAFLTSKLLSCCVPFSAERDGHHYLHFGDTGFAALSMPALFFFRALRAPTDSERWWLWQAVAGHPAPAEALLHSPRFLKGHPELIPLLLQFPKLSWEEGSRLVEAHLLRVGSPATPPPPCAGPSSLSPFEEGEASTLARRTPPEGEGQEGINAESSGEALPTDEDGASQLPREVKEPAEKKESDHRMNPRVWESIIREWGSEDPPVRCKRALHFLKTAGYPKRDADGGAAAKEESAGEEGSPTDSLGMPCREDEKVAERMIQMLQGGGRII